MGERKEGVSREKAITKVAAVFGTSIHSVRRAVDEYDPENKGVHAKPGLIVDNVRDVESKYREWTRDEQAFIKSMLKQRADAGQTTNLPQLRAALRAAPQHFAFAEWAGWVLRERLAEMNIVYGKGHFVTRSKDDLKVTMQRREYALQFARALEEERAGRAVIVYTDESYVHVRHHHTRTLFLADSTTGANVNSGSGKGCLLILLHAITEDGLLTTCDESERHFIPSQSATGTVLSSQLIYYGTAASDDYHKHVDAHTFENWVRNRLFPTFKRVHPGKNMILVLDNAAYHRARGKDYITLSKSKKEDIIKYLIQMGVSRVQRDDTKEFISLFDWNSTKRKQGVTVRHLTNRVKQLWAENPALVQTQLQNIFAQESKESKCAHEVLYTVPYESESQPIEKLWARVKRHVANLHTARRTKAQLLEQTLDGFYGDSKTIGPVSRVTVGPWIDHAKKVVTEWIRNDHMLRALWSAGESVTVDSLSPAKIAAYRQKNTFIINFDDCEDDGVDEPFINDQADSVAVL